MSTACGKRNGVLSAVSFSKTAEAVKLNFYISSISVLLALRSLVQNNAVIHFIQINVLAELEATVFHMKAL